MQYFERVFNTCFINKTLLTKLFPKLYLKIKYTTINVNLLILIREENAWINLLFFHWEKCRTYARWRLNTLTVSTFILIFSVCAETYHGLSCNLSCSEYCKDRLCDPVTGFCDACIDQRSGDFCENESSVNDHAAGMFY